MRDTATVQSESSRSRSFPWWTVWGFIGLFVFYPLSTGPVIRIASEFTNNFASNEPVWQFVETVYAPLVFLSDHYEPVESFFTWYILFWCPNLFG